MCFLCIPGIIMSWSGNRLSSRRPLHNWRLVAKSHGGFLPGKVTVTAKATTLTLETGCMWHCLSSQPRHTGCVGSQLSAAAQSALCGCQLPLWLLPSAISGMCNGGVPFKLHHFWAAVFHHPRCTIHQLARTARRGRRLQKEFKASNGWLEKWKNQHNLKQRNVASKEGDVNDDTVCSLMERVKELTLGYARQDIWNMYELGAFWLVLPEKSLTEKMLGRKTSKIKSNCCILC